MDIEKATRDMPAFKSHEEAKRWFQQMFHGSFFIRYSETFQGKKMYCYHIIRNKELYQTYMQTFATNTKPIITNMEVFNSYATVEISEIGEVKIFI